MKIRLISDGHLEGGMPLVYERLDEDILVLAGDIHTRNRLHLFLDTLPADLPVYFVLGNHEYYHMFVDEVKQYHKDLENTYNFKLLDNTTTEVHGIPMFGGTMFTDFELYGTGEAWFAKHRAKDGINDFEVIKKMGEFYEPARWTVQDHIAEHHKFHDAFRIFLKHTEGAEKRIVITHFMPTDKCTGPQFKGNTLNPYFTTNMEPYMGFPGVWLCGHGHTPADFFVDETRVVMNPRGYLTKRHAENPNFNPNLIIEI